MTEAFFNLLLLTLGAAVVAVWIVSLAKWDGKVHCDKSRCEDCPYYPDCKYAKEDDQK